MPSVNELLALDLAPMEFKAACFMLTLNDGVIRCTTTQVSEVLKCGDSTARRVIANLVEIGLIVRVARGIFILPTKTTERSPASVSTTERSSASESGCVYVDYKLTNSQESLEEPNGSSNSRAPREMKVQIMINDYDDGDDLGGYGHLDPRETTADRARSKKLRVQEERQKVRDERRRELKFHRLTPRDEWDTTFVIKEFRHRMAKERPDILGGGVDGPRMLKVLNTWQVQHNLTPQTMATAVDLFFDSGIVPTLEESPKPYRLFLSFLQTHYRDIVSQEPDDEWLGSLDQQLEDFK